MSDIPSAVALQRVLALLAARDRRIARQAGGTRTRRGMMSIDAPRPTGMPTECQASLRDGECVHERCPNGGMRDIPQSCPLPWLRMDRALEDET